MKIIKDLSYLHRGRKKSGRRGTIPTETQRKIGQDRKGIYTVSGKSRQTDETTQPAEPKKQMLAPCPICGTLSKPCLQSHSGRWHFQLCSAAFTQNLRSLFTLEQDYIHLSFLYLFHLPPFSICSWFCQTLHFAQRFISTTIVCLCFPSWGFPLVRLLSSLIWQKKRFIPLIIIVFSQLPGRHIKKKRWLWRLGSTVLHRRNDFRSHLYSLLLKKVSNSAVWQNNLICLNRLACTLDQKED